MGKLLKLKEEEKVVQTNSIVSLRDRLVSYLSDRELEFKNDFEAIKALQIVQQLCEGGDSGEYRKTLMDIWKEVKSTYEEGSTKSTQEEELKIDAI